MNVGTVTQKPKSKPNIAKVATAVQMNLITIACGLITA